MESTSELSHGRNGSQTLRAEHQGAKTQKECAKTENWPGDKIAVHREPVSHSWQCSVPLETQTRLLFRNFASQTIKDKSLGTSKESKSPSDLRQQLRDFSRDP